MIFKKVLVSYAVSNFFIGIFFYWTRCHFVSFIHLVCVDYAFTMLNIFHAKQLQWKIKRELSFKEITKIWNACTRVTQSKLDELMRISENSTLGCRWTRHLWCTLFCRQNSLVFELNLSHIKKKKSWNKASDADTFLFLPGIWDWYPHEPRRTSIINAQSHCTVTWKQFSELTIVK